MTSEQKQIAIAEFEGWTQPEKGFWQDRQGHNWQVMHGWQTYKDGSDILPPYLASRDAICGAAGRLSSRQKQAFASKLEGIVFGRERPKAASPEEYYGYIELPPEDITAMILATPAQMADALLLTLGFKI